MEYDDIAFDVDEDDEPSDADPDNDLPPGFSASHSRFSSMPDPFGDLESEEDPTCVEQTDLSHRIDRYLEALLFPQR